MQKRIHLIRHGLSVSNIDLRKNIHTPDHKIELDKQGHKQAAKAGTELARILHEAKELNRQRYTQVRMLISPYIRTMQTADKIKDQLFKEGVTFETREALGLREQEFGLFNGYSTEEIKDLFPAEYAHFIKHINVSGEFFASMPMGESQADVCDRVRPTIGDILRCFDRKEQPPITDVVIVGHGVSNRCFIKEFMNHSWEWMERSSNPNNCSITTIAGDIDCGWTVRQTFEGFEHSKKPGHEILEKREAGQLE